MRRPEGAVLKARGIRRHGLGIREKVTALSGLACLVTMAVLVAVVSLSLESFLKTSMRDSLVERLDQAEELVRQGEYQRAVDLTGSDLLQLVDTSGKVLYSSPNALGLSLVAVLDDDEMEVDDLLFDREDDDGDDEDDEPDEDNDEYKGDDVDDGGDGEGEKDDEDDEQDEGSDIDDDDALDVGGLDAAGDEDDERDADKWDAVGEENDVELDDEDDWDDEDDADEDEDDEYEARYDGREVARGFSPFIRAAFALESGAASSAEDGEPYVDASEALGTRGPYLVMRRRVSSPDGPMELLAITSLAPALDAARSMAHTLMLAFCVVFVIVLAFVWHVVGLTLGPVATMRQEVDAITSSNLSRRVKVPQGDRDLAPLATTFNALLERIERAVDEQKRFLSDASHELKSPLAASGLIIETLATQPGADAQALADLALENERAADIVQNLLVLARADEGRMAPNVRALDLADLLFEEVAHVPSYEDVRMDVAGVAPLVVSADCDLLGRAVRNLLANAVHYAATTVRVSCEERGGRVRIVVEDDGKGIAQEQRERAFDRFVRLDAGPLRGQEGTGLGLPVVRSVVEAQGGTVGFEDTELGGVAAVIELPGERA